MRNPVFPLCLSLGFLAGFGQPMLAWAGQPAEPTAASLVAVLQSDATRKEKADACRELARVGGKEAVAPLAALLGDEELSHMARYALESIPGSSVDKALRSALDTVQGKPLVGVIGSVGFRRDDKAVKQLTRLLNGTDAEVTHASARALGRIGTPEAGAALTAALTSAPAGDRAAISVVFGSGAGWRVARGHFRPRFR
jgi:HEAT repeat protein